MFGYNEDTSVIDEGFLKACVHTMFFKLDLDPTHLEAIITKLSDDIGSTPEKSAHQSLFLLLKEQYGSKDVGLLFIFFLNILTLQRDEALVITPNEPHAYISGDLVECMANSDNVVRGGLTPKFKDTETLFSMLPYSTMNVQRIPLQGQVVFTESGS